MQLATQASQASAARREALSWLARQLRWERTLDELREGKSQSRRRAA